MKTWMFCRLIRLAHVALVCTFVLALWALFAKMRVHDGETVSVLVQDSLQVRQNKSFSDKPHLPPLDSGFLSVKEDIENRPRVALLGLATMDHGSVALVEWNGAQRLIRPGESYDGWRVDAIDLKGVSLCDSKGRVAAVSYPVSVPESKVSGAKNVDPLPKNLSIRNIFSKWGEIMRQVRIMPFVEEGQSIGYEVLYIEPNSFVQKMGFRIGDIIKKVNGLEITNLESLLQVYQDEKIDSMAFEIRRGFEEMTLVCRGSDLNLGSGKNASDALGGTGRNLGRGAEIHETV